MALDSLCIDSLYALILNTSLSCKTCKSSKSFEGRTLGQWLRTFWDKLWVTEMS